MLAGVSGGILSSVGRDLYNTIKGEFFQTSISLISQTFFASIGIIGLVLIMSDYLGRKNRGEKTRRKSRR